MRKILMLVGALVVVGAAGLLAFKQIAPGNPQTAAAAPITTQTSQTTPATQTTQIAPAPAATTSAPAAGQQTTDAGEPALYPDDTYLGSADAKVTVIEYASLSCPHCAKFNADVFPRLKTDYIDKGLVRWVYRDYPLNNPAYLAAVLAHCASPLRYFGMIDKLFRSQDYWAAQPQPIVALHQIGVSEGVDEKTYDACLADQKLKDKIISRLQEASTKYKIDATPSFVVRGAVHAGEISYDDFKKLIDDALGHS
jgi:protein-disulfide isomerase